MKLLLIFLTLVFSSNAFAYIDPGAGSLLIQMLVAGVMGAIFTIKMYWFRLKSYIQKLMGKDVSSDDLSNTSDDKDNLEISNKKDD